MIRTCLSRLCGLRASVCSVWHHSSSRALHNSATFRFAEGTSDNGNLYKAMQEVVQSVQQQIDGRAVDFCQLFVTTKHMCNLAHAPECLLDNIKRKVDPAGSPVIIGGALQSVCGAGKLIKSRPGVSLLAACLPGVELFPFHVREPSLPAFTAEQWSKLLQKPAAYSPPGNQHSSSRDGTADAQGRNQLGSSSSSSSSGNRAAVLLSAPHFVEVETLLQRLSGALPGMPVVGGVTERDAWIDTEHDYGALFCGSSVHSMGAVGCIMQGPLAMQHLLLPGCRPAGAVMTVTEAAGNVIFALDGKPVHDSFVTLLHSLPRDDQKRELHLGVNDTALAGPAAAAAATAGSGTAAAAASSGAGGAVGSQGFVARHMSLVPTGYGRPVLMVATHEVPIGARVQLLVRDLDSNHQQQQQALTALSQQLPAAAVRDPHQLALLGYCCVALPHNEAQVVADCLPQVPFAGGRMQGEFAGAPHSAGAQQNKAAAATEAGGAAAAAAGDSAGQSDVGAKLHSYAASFAVIHHQDLAVTGTQYFP